MISAIKSIEKPKGRLTALWQKIAPIPSWATMIYTVLHNSGYL